MKTHLHYCKCKPEYDACNGSTPKEVLSSQRHQQDLQRCPHCNELFTCLKTHMHHCKQEPGNDERNGNKQKPAGGELEIGCRKTDTSGKQKCPSCHPPSKWSSSDSCDIRQLAHLEPKLKKRLRDTRVDQRQPVEVSDTIGKIKNAVLETLKDDFPSTRWEAINSGSYYELVKVSLTTITPESLSFLNKSLTFAKQVYQGSKV